MLIQLVFGHRLGRRGLLQRILTKWLEWKTGKTVVLM
jgi:hypothetical protein